MPLPEQHDSAAAVADRIVESLEGRIVLGLPLGLGKAGRVANALYARARSDAAISLDIFTALTLEPPTASSDMERRFIEPLSERLFSGCERLDYATDLRAGEMPGNIRVSEFFLLAGGWLGVPAAQRAYVSANYTHAARLLLDKGVNVLAQLVARRGEGAEARYSLSCNTDITLDLLPMLQAAGRRVLMVGEVSAALPFMDGEAALPAGRFDLLLETAGREPRLFAPPKEPVSQADHAIGIHAASLVRDGGTLQIGIGSLGDAFVAALVLRHRDPDLFRKTLARLCGGQVPQGRCTQPFDKGLYGASEMFVDGFMELYRVGILKRPASDGSLLHAGFFLGPEPFYAWLRDLPEDERALFSMREISFVNELHGDEHLKRADRVDARFVNSAMMATMLGETISDALEDGRVVSGVGGQYNFVAQAFALESARSIITLNATRMDKGTACSRILWTYGHTTIPRHLRDVFVTEYGVADLRGRTDRDCIAAMLRIADARFQDQLLATAVDAGKIEPGHRIPTSARGNRAARVADALAPARAAGYCATFPFGTAFTEIERRLLPALADLRAHTATRLSMARSLLSALTGRVPSGRYTAELERMDLARARSTREKLERALLLWALARVDDPPTTA